MGIGAGWSDAVRTAGPGLRGSMGAASGGAGGRVGACGGATSR